MFKSPQIILASGLQLQTIYVYVPNGICLHLVFQKLPKFQCQRVYCCTLIQWSGVVFMLAVDANIPKFKGCLNWGVFNWGVFNWGVINRLSGPEVGYFTEGG